MKLDDEKQEKLKYIGIKFIWWIIIFLAILVLLFLINPFIRAVIEVFK